MRFFIHSHRRFSTIIALFHLSQQERISFASEFCFSICGIALGTRISDHWSRSFNRRRMGERISGIDQEWITLERHQNHRRLQRWWHKIAGWILLSEKLHCHKIADWILLSEILLRIPQKATAEGRKKRTTKTSIILTTFIFRTMVPISFAETVVAATQAAPRAKENESTTPIKRRGLSEKRKLPQRTKTRIFRPKRLPKNQRTL